MIGIFQFSLVLALLLVSGAGRLSLNPFHWHSFIFILVTIPFWILQGGVEELIMRGWLFPIITAKSTMLLGIVLSSALFGVLHLLNAGVTVLSIVNIVLYGIFTCLYMLKTDNLWGVAGTHGAWNFVQGNIYGVQVSGQNASHSLFTYSNQSSIEWISGGHFGAEGTIVTTLVLMISIFYLYNPLRKRGLRLYTK